MPLSLVFFRWLGNVLGQRSGILFFAGTMVFTHVTMATVEAVAEKQDAVWTLMIAVRLLQGLSAAVLFQTRFILSQVSTQDKHVELQAKTFLVGNLGLGIGALLPYACALMGGLNDPTSRQPEIVSSVLFASAASILLVWTWFAFPASLYRLPYSARFPERLKQLPGQKDAIVAIEEGSRLVEA